MRIRFILLFIIISHVSFSQIIQPPFYGLFQDDEPLTPIGGNASCNGIAITAVVPFTSTTGKIWMDRNLGASRTPTAIDDYKAYGCLYQWGRGNDKHASINWTDNLTGSPVNGSSAVLSNTNTPGNALFITSTTDWRAIQNDALWQGINGINNPCPAGYRLPTSSEITNELNAYAMTDQLTAYNSPFKFTVAGRRTNSNGVLAAIGSGFYWTSTVSSSQSFYFHDGPFSSFIGNSERANGYSVRCIKEPPPLPVAGNAVCDGNTQTTVVPITSSTGKIWMDRNLGASRAAISATDYEAYGCMYQWGRGNDGHASVTWTTSSAGTTVNGFTTTKSATDTPGNALFITSLIGDWRSSQNDMLWQGLNGVNNPCPTGYRLPTNTEFTAEFTAYAITNSAKAYANGPNGGFKFVLAGMIDNSFGDFVLTSVRGCYATSVVGSEGKVYYAFIDSATLNLNQYYRASGYSLRCIHD